MHVLSPGRRALPGSMVRAVRALGQHLSGARKEGALAENLKGASRYHHPPPSKGIVSIHIAVHPGRPRVSLQTACISGLLAPH